MNSKKLAELLQAMFGAQELRRLIHFNFGAEVADALPEGSAPLAVMAASVVVELEKRRLVGRELFALLRSVRAGWKLEIDALERGWTQAAEVVAPSIAPAFEWLDAAQLRAVYRAALDAGLARDASLDALVLGIHAGYVASITAGGATNVRLLTTLQKMNGVRNLQDGTIPLARWLENASDLTIGLPAEQVFAAALQRVHQAGAAAPDPPAAVSDADLANLRLERVISPSDQSVSAVFLLRGAAAVGSVARVLVHRHFGGVPSTLAGGVADYSLGTGWLIARELLITNHHVLAARGDGEPAATTDDFGLQVATVEVQFDFVHAAGASESHRGLSLVAADAGLDFALLRLPACGRPPLRLRATGLRRSAAAPLKERVNLLQHPNGEPMRIGFRNNFVVRGDDRWLSYLTDTHGGSSGSPVCDDAWSVVALHRGYRILSGAAVKLDGITIKTENYGVQLPAILEWLKVHCPAAHQEIQDGQAPVA